MLEITHSFYLSLSFLISQQPTIFRLLLSNLLVFRLLYKYLNLSTTLTKIRLHLIIDLVIC